MLITQGRSKGSRLVATFLALALGSSLANSVDVGVNVWSSMEKHLKKEIDSNEIEDNMKVAREILNDEANTKPLLINNEKYMKALRHFLDLDELKGGNRCDTDGYRLIEHVEKHVANSMFHEFSRINSVLMRVKERYGKDCYDIYMAQLEERKRNTANNGDIQTVTRAFEDVISSISVDIEPKNLDMYIIRVENYKSLWTKSVILDLYRPCKEMFPEVANNKERLEKCVLNTCPMFEVTFRDILELASLIDLQPKRAENQEKSLEFFLTWARYKLCWTFRAVGLDRMSEQIKFMDHIDENPRHGCELGYTHKGSANICVDAYKN